jgi:S1-C subfamily serine protease
VITKINGAPAASPVQLQELTLSKQAGHTVDLEVGRSGQSASVTVTLDTQP